MAGTGNVASINLELPRRRSVPRELWHKPTDGHSAKFWDRFRFIHWSAFGRGEDFFASIICLRTPACLRTEEGFTSKGKGWNESRRNVSLLSRAKQVARSSSGSCVGFPALRHQQGKKKKGGNECKDGPTRKRDRPPFFYFDPPPQELFASGPLP